MKNIAFCYSEQAIKVSNSYCSGLSNQTHTSSHLIPSIQNAVTCIYKVKLSTQKQFLISLTWSNLLNKGFSIGICEYPFSTSKFTKNFRVLRKGRGEETFDASSFRIAVLWDLCRAKYDTGPEPVTGFYVVILVDEELSLILGDMEQELEIKKRVSDKRVSDYLLISRNERFSGNAVYSTRAKFCDTGICHDILVKCFDETSGNTVLSVYIDKKNVIQVKRLHWNFRGNQTIFLDGLLVDFMWNVHDWFFSPTSRYAVFLFRTRKGLDSRLWLEDKNFEPNEQGEKFGFSFLISGRKTPD